MTLLSAHDIGGKSPLNEFYMFEFEFYLGEISSKSKARSLEIILLINPDHNGFQVYKPDDILLKPLIMKMIYTEFFNFLYVANPRKEILAELKRRMIKGK